jgi:peptidoglycan hydrolase-like protein with peptidoglycan-binding domain
MIDEFESIARAAGAELRRPAPAGAVDRIQGVARRGQIRHRIGVSGITTIALIGGFVAVDRARRPDVISNRTGSVAAESSLDTTVVTSLGETSPTIVGSTSTTLPKTVLQRTLARGDKGDDVKMVQQRLTDLRFDVGVVDGDFGDNTRAAVWAYEGLVFQSAAKKTGKVTAELWARMQEPLGLGDWRPTIPFERKVYVSLPWQVMIVWNKDAVELITHISSGSGQEWCEVPENVPAWPGATTTTTPAGRNQRICGKSVTPGGIYQIYRKEKGEYEIPLGRVYDPLYFNMGVAIHGSKDVPDRPASHGCVRVPLHIGARLYDLLRRNDAVYVFDGVKHPETYGRQAPPNDTLDPTDDQFSTTTSSSTTTAAHASTR